MPRRDSGERLRVDRHVRRPSVAGARVRTKKIELAAAYLVRRRDFDQIERGDEWSIPELGIDSERRSIADLVDDDALALADLWGRSRGGFGELAHLPYGGGMAEQPAKLMDGFAIVARTVELLKPKGS